MGGCVSRHPEFPNSAHPNIFTVHSVTRPLSADTIEINSITGTTNIGDRNTAGQLEVTATELILHRRDHEPVHWPLQYVRRYGFENHLFSFESGRRCESGPGIFTFRCRRAHELFLLVQANVQDARSPPPQPQHAASMENAVAALERSRTSSMPSQFRFPGSRGAVVQMAYPRTEGSLTPRLVGLSETTVVADESQNVAALSPESQTLADNPDTPTGNQIATSTADVFLDMALPHNGLEKVQLEKTQLQRQRISSVQSHASSSANSDHSLSSFEKGAAIRRRPISFECDMIPAIESSSRDGSDISTFVSPKDEPASATNAASPTTPPSMPYYVNVNPNGDQEQRQAVDQRQHIYQNKILAGVRRPPGRSQSLGSTGSDTCDQQRHHDLIAEATGYRSCDNATSSNGGSSSLNFPLRTSKPGYKDQPNSESEPVNENVAAAMGPLNYVTIDVGHTGAASSRVGRSDTWAPSFPCPLYKHHAKRPSPRASGVFNGLSSSASAAGVTAGRSLTSVAEIGNAHISFNVPNETNGNELPVDNAQPLEPGGNGAASMNYARIDCARTKALRETAAAAQLQRRSTSCSASSTEATDTNVSALAGRRKHFDGPLSLGRRKHKSGSIEP